MQRLVLIPLLPNTIVLECLESSIGHHSKTYDKFNKIKHYKKSSILTEPEDDLESKENLEVADRVQEQTKSLTKTGNKSKAKLFEINRIFLIYEQ